MSINMMRAVALLGMAGLFGGYGGRSSVLIEDEDPRDAFKRLTSDPIDQITRALNEARPSPQPAPRYPWQSRAVEHFETPKPLTKRQKRRLRGRG